MAYENADENMEMPTPCQKCGGWFDLLDGCGSEKWFPNTVICESCSNIEEQEIELENDIDDLKREMEDAEFTLKDGKERLVQLSVINLPVLFLIIA